jgi:drug/metabolite transporter (DMT)-like permease
MAVLSAVSYGAALPLSRLAYDHGTNALTILTLRYLAIVLVMAVWLRGTRQSFFMPAKLLAASAAIGVAFCAISGGTLGAINFIPVSLTVLVFYTYPILTLLLVCTMDRRSPRTDELVAVLAAFIGVGLAVQVSFAELHPGGIGLAVLAALGASGSFIIVSRVMADTGTTIVSLYACGMAFALGVAMTAIWGEFALPTGGIGMALLAVILIIFGTAIVAMFVALKLIGPVRAATLLCLEPVTAILIAVLLLGEHLTPGQWLGAALVATAMGLASRRPAP